jgi:hypothetical protein
VNLPWTTRSIWRCWTSLDTHRTASRQQWSQVGQAVVSEQAIPAHFHREADDHRSYASVDIRWTYSQKLNITQRQVWYVLHKLDDQPQLNPFFDLEVRMSRFRSRTWDSWQCCPVRIRSS